MPEPIVDIRGHFRLSALPFTRELTIDKRFSFPDFDFAYTELRQAIEDRSSAALTAPAGTGKTILLRALRASLPEARFKVSYLKVTGLGKRDMCREIAHAIGIEPAAQYNTLVRKLQESFTASSRDGLRCVLLIDEAHDMPPDVLSIFRLLTNFDMDSRLALSVLFCGQPYLATLLARDQLDAIAQRLACFVSLTNLSRELATDYLRHRLLLAGARTELFTEHAIDALYEMARGNMRATDTLALKALHVAARKNVHRVETEHLLMARSQVLP